MRAAGDHGCDVSRWPKEYGCKKVDQAKRLKALGQ
jgi:hypothetical protein